MAAALDENQIQYLRDVLGLQNVILPFVAAPAPDPVAETPLAPRKPMVHIAGSLASARMIVCFAPSEAEFPLFGEAKSLAERMIKAMKLELGEILWLEWPASEEASVPEQILDLASQAGHRPILIFGSDAAEALTGSAPPLGKWKEVFDTKVMTTYSPKELLRAPELKKPSWAHLQTVMRELV